MYLKTYSYRFADEILSAPGYCEVKQELLDICFDCPIAVYPGKSANQRGKDVVQQIMNTYFRIQFEEYGWEVEPSATPDDYSDALKADFRKTFHFQDQEPLTVQIEVEFGNAASSYRNYFKFQLSFSYGMTDICVLIVPSYNLANRIDSGVANYEKVIRELPQAKLSVTVPIFVIGLFDEDEYGDYLEEWNIREMEVPLMVAQNKNRSVSQAHEDLVRDYLEWINRR